MNNNCKILAPVGSMDVLKAAVFSGADCVYLSGIKYGARDFADNFDYDQLKEAINYCHEHNVLVFVTVNISILESEMLDVVDYVFYLYSHGVDGVIIQDIGLADVVHNLIPDLSIHASTQMTIYDYSFVKWLSENGFDNANLSREVPLNRIKDIISKLSEFNHDIKIEVFGHGALCYCYSGACLMSSFLGGRSGNRGLCAQPCRMRYTVEDCYYGRINDSNYLLSTKDLCIYNHIEDVVDCGVDCIKIEGRMKSKEYVSSSTYCYKEALKGNISKENYLLLNLAFNRGLTSGYINENLPDKVVGRERSGSQGYPIGKVIKVNKNKVTIKFGNRQYPTKLVRGDGIKFEYDGIESGMYVSKIVSQSKNKITLVLDKNMSVEKDALVYITYSKYLKDKTNEIINKDNIHKTTLDLEINIDNQRHLCIKCNGDSLKKPIEYTSKTPFDIAVNKPLTKETINRQLQKTGDTNYIINKITYENFQDNLFMPISQLNDIRRQLIEQADKTIMNYYIPSKKEIEQVKNNIKTFKNNYYKSNDNNTEKQSWNVYIDTLEQAKLVKDYEFIETVYYDSSYNHKTIHEYTHEITDELVNLSRIIPNKNIVWVLQPLLLDEDLPHIAEIILKLDFLNINIKVQTDNIGIADNMNADCYGNNLNIYNNHSIKKLSENPKFKRLCVSNEIAYEDIRKLNKNDNCQLEYIIFGNVQLMISEDNFEDIIKEKTDMPYYLVDKRNNHFKLLFDCYNHSHIFDYRILDLSDELKKLENTAISTLSIDLRFFDMKYTKEVLNYFNNLITENNKQTLPKKEYYKCNFERGIYKN